MKLYDAKIRINLLIRSIQDDLSMVEALKLGCDNPHDRAKMMGKVEQSFKAHRDDLLSTVSEFTQAATLEVCGNDIT